jgi:hypothetical protein
MIKRATFSIDDCTIQVPTKTSSVNITLWLQGKHNRARSYPISGFPRIIMAEESLKSMSTALFRMIMPSTIPNMLTFTVSMAKPSGLRKHKSFPSAMNLPGRAIDSTRRSKSIQVPGDQSPYQIDTLIYKETQAWTGQPEDEEHSSPSFGARHHFLQSNQQQLPLGSRPSAARPTRMESSPLLRSSSLPRRAIVEPRLKSPSDLDPEFQRELGPAKDPSSHDEIWDGQDEVGIWEHPPENVDDSPEMELMVGSERSVWG